MLRPRPVRAVRLTPHGSAQPWKTRLPLADPRLAAEISAFGKPVLRQQEALRLNQSAVHREEAAKELREEASKLVQRLARAAEE
ncbi:unnamed protein product, partial [Effrenium voratum]